MPSAALEGQICGTLTVVDPLNFCLQPDCPPIGQIEAGCDMQHSPTAEPLRANSIRFFFYHRQPPGSVTFTLLIKIIKVATPPQSSILCSFPLAAPNKITVTWLLVSFMNSELHNLEEHAHMSHCQMRRNCREISYVLVHNIYSNYPALSVYEAEIL